MTQAFWKHLFGKSDLWSIGIYAGDSPYRLAAPAGLRNPVLTAREVTDRKAEFVADPFLIKDKDQWYMFFEVMDICSSKGEIGLAVSSDGFHWAYKQIVLSEPFHLSYPYVFKWGDEYYLVPESRKAGSVRLYRSVDFPFKWEYVTDLLKGVFADTSIFNHADKWWLFTLAPKGEKFVDDTLLLYFADTLCGPWREHPCSPIKRKDPHTARPAGRILVENGKIIRYAQIDAPVYGSGVFAFEITELTTSRYAEREVLENPILKPGGEGWNKDGMHTVDPHLIGKDRWLACVDGNVRRLWVAHILHKIFLNPRHLKRIFSLGRNMY